MSTDTHTHALPTVESPEASAAIDSVLAEYSYPANPKNAARAGYEAARRLLIRKTEDSRLHKESNNDRT